VACSNDDSFDRHGVSVRVLLYQPRHRDPGCTGTQGTELTNFEALDVSFDPATGITPDVTGGGTLGQVLTQLDPKKMQRRLVEGECQPVFPHQYIAPTPSSRSSRRQAA